MLSSGSIPPFYVKARWCKEYKRSRSCVMDEVRIYNKQCSTFGERSRQVSAIVSEAGSTIFYNDVAYDIMLRGLIRGIKDARSYLVSNNITKEPLRSECSTRPVDEKEEDYSGKTIKRRQNPIKSKNRLMSESEKRHLIKKQQRKRAIEQEKQRSRN